MHLINDFVLNTELAIQKNVNVYFEYNRCFKTSLFRYETEYYFNVDSYRLKLGSELY
jgi:hypothetical protein